MEELATRENTNRKIWAAKFAARHPNLVALELSNFKCGHDAPIYTVIEEIIENSRARRTSASRTSTRTSRPARSSIRVETIDYFLKRYREDMVRDAQKRETLEERLAELERQLRAEAGGNLAGVRR